MEGGILVIVLYIDRNRLQFFEAGWSSIASLDLPETVVRDLEVVSRGEFVKLVQSFLRKNALRPAAMLFILSEATYFSQVLVGEEPVKEQQLENVIPKNFTETMEQTFEEEGFSVTAMVPAHVLGSMREKRWLDIAMGTYALKEANALVRQSILTHSESATSRGAKEPTKQNQRLMIFMGIFIFLILIFIFFILRS
ncbi:hypothetical protein HYV22_02440 [Candidatus Gottesmanbacteria bacterium]|nr:hypothetical protein [Candidatus Gottesmanbacteria bacterium]